MDNMTRKQRRRNMRRIKSKNTKPERIVRGVLRDLGFPGYRLHRRDLPGTPDIVYISRRLVIFVNGCFWHACKKCGRFQIPKTRKKFWKNKIEGNVKRDKKNAKILKGDGWNVVVVWECELEKMSNLKRRLRYHLDKTREST